MKKTCVILLAGLCLIGWRGAFAQSPAPRQAASVTVPDNSGEDIKLFRKDVRSLRKQIIAANLDLSDSEAEKFWPSSTSTRRSW